MTIIKGANLRWSNLLTNRNLIILFSFLFAALILYYLFGYAPLTPYQLRGVAIGLAVTLAALVNPPKNTVYRILLAAAVLGIWGSVIYVMIAEEAITKNFFMARQPEVYAFIVFFIGLTIVCTRISGGYIVLALTVIIILYQFFGQYLPGLFSHAPFPITWITTMAFTDMDQGANGMFTEVAVRLITIFMMFAVMLLVSGLGDLIIAAATGLLGHQTGGPAKIAVIASGGFGMISGSPVANVAATGSFTIPMMKKIGYNPSTAATVEALASSGGALMPPIMGIGAFLMAEILGVPYLYICLVAVIPALLWYYACFLNVHFTAYRQRVSRYRPPREEWMGTVKSRFHLVFSVLALIIALVFLPAEQGAFFGFIFLVLLTFIRKETRLNWTKITDFLLMFARSYASLFVLIVLLGIFIGGMLSSGLHMKIGQILLGGIEQWYFVLLLSFAMTVVLGMVVPVTATYLAVAAIVGPLLVGLGYDILNVHMFIWYTACLAPITPPVALASITAAGIAGSPPFKTGLEATWRGLSLWIMPFAIFSWTLYLGMGTPWQTLVLGVGMLIFGVFVFTLGAAGYFTRDLNRIERAVAVILGILIVQPIAQEISYVCMVLAAIFVVYIFLHTRLKRREAAKLPS